MSFGSVLAAATPGDIVVEHGSGVLIAHDTGRSALKTLAEGPPFGFDEWTFTRPTLDTIDGPVTTAVRPGAHTFGIGVVMGRPFAGTPNPSALVRAMMEPRIEPQKVGWVGLGSGDDPMWRYGLPLDPKKANGWDNDAQRLNVTRWRLEWSAVDTTIHTL